MLCPVHNIITLSTTSLPVCRECLVAPTQTSIRCPKCGGRMYTEYDDHVYALVCLCGKEIYIDPEPQKRPPEPEERPKDPKAAQQKALKRYRAGPLFKETNRRIQRRYRKSPKGQQVLSDQRNRNRILRKLAKLTKRDLPRCEPHGEIIVIREMCSQCMRAAGYDV